MSNIEDRLARLERQLHRTRLALGVIGGVLVLACTLGAGPPLVDLVCKGLVVKNAAGTKTVVELTDSGDATISGNLKIDNDAAVIGNLTIDKDVAITGKLKISGKAVAFEELERKVDELEIGPLTGTWWRSGNNDRCTLIQVGRIVILNTESDGPTLGQWDGANNIKDIVSTQKWSVKSASISKDKQTITFASQDKWTR